jgi:succinate dehydrogenase / fumarate reductase cytochrome b subunit
MSWFSNALTSTIGRKVVMSLTGLFLVSFLVVHLSGNFLLFKSDGGAAFNLYSKFMSTNGLVRVLELGLVAGFVLHIFTAIVLTQRNKSARPVQYAYERADTNSSWFSRNMVPSGVIILVFLIIHLKSYWFEYKFGEVGNIMIEGTEYKDMYALVKASFEQEWYTAIYVIAFVLLGFHLNHGFQSAFQSLGLNHKKYTPAIKSVGTLVAIALSVGFSIIPIFFLVKKYMN